MHGFGVSAAAFVLLLFAVGCRNEEPSTAPRAREAMRAHVDEEGNFVAPPPATPTPLGGKRSVEEKIPDWESAPGGGEMIRLDGALRKHAE